MSSIQDKFASFLQSTVQEKDEEIKSLREQNERLREENERLKQSKASDPQNSSSRYAEMKSRAIDLKKVLEDFLEHPSLNRSGPTYQQRIPPTFPPISVPNSNADVNKPSTSTNARSDEPLVNGTNHLTNRPNFPEEFVASRQESDTDIINQADEMARPFHYHNSMDKHNVRNSHSHNLPTAMLPNGINNPQRRFGYNNGLSGMNNNNNNNNNNNRNRNNHNNNNKHTIFISWPGTATSDELKELFEKEGIDFADIRYTHPKQFAHVDLKNEHALSKAMILNGQTKSEKQGALRVELGKPRSSNNNNPTENNQRSQNQNKNYNRPNNKNSNGYNNSLPQKQNKNFNYNNHNNHNNHDNHNSQYTPNFVPSSDDKENGTSAWQQQFSQEISKQNGEN